MWGRPLAGDGGDTGVVNGEHTDTEKRRANRRGGGGTLGRAAVGGVRGEKGAGTRGGRSRTGMGAGDKIFVVFPKGEGGPAVKGKVRAFSLRSRRWPRGPGLGKQAGLGEHPVGGRGGVGNGTASALSGSWAVGRAGAGRGFTVQKALTMGLWGTQPLFGFRRGPRLSDPGKKTRVPAPTLPSVHGGRHLDRAGDGQGAFSGVRGAAQAAGAHRNQGGRPNCVPLEQGRGVPRHFPCIGVFPKGQGPAIRPVRATVKAERGAGQWVMGGGTGACFDVDGARFP